MPQLSASFGEIRHSIQAACQAQGRDPPGVQLVAVSKGRPAEKILELHKLGQRAFGENRAQELLEKAQALAGKNIEWHFIGRLQSNKVRKLLPVASLIHSLGSLELARKIDREAQHLCQKARVLIQVNIANEPTKQGFREEEVEEALREMGSLSHLSIEGLMCFPPELEPEKVRPHFRRMAVLFERLKNFKSSNWFLKHLSMGSSNDFGVAVKEGSTMVRIGRKLFAESEKENLQANGS